MHGAPLVQGVEIYHDRPIFYDLGNFIFNMPPTGNLDEPIIWEGVVAYLEYRGKNLQSITFRPIFLNKIGEASRTFTTGTRTTFFSTPAACLRGRRVIKGVIFSNDWLTPQGRSEQRSRSKEIRGRLI
jgi:poly-gamma-glutamate capsule biosynthesis protein CapA/YwtB (metallophosphatase superfamily)